MIEVLSKISADLSGILPEIAIVVLLLLCIAGELILSESYKGKVLDALMVVGLLVVSALLIYQFQNITDAQRLFSGMITIDRGSIFWRILFVAGASLATVINFRRNSDDKAGEYGALVMVILLGANLLSMSSHLLSIYLSLELISISSYILTTFSFNKQSSEAGIKYLIFGAVSSAIMLYGISMVYGITLTLDFTGNNFTALLLSADTMPLLIGGIMIFAGFFFKISAAPFHIWSPDVYTVAPTAAVAYFSVVPKLAGVAVIMRWMLVINLYGLSMVDWQLILGAVAALSILVGNFGALRQTNVKRMLAYSSIAQSGFMLLGIVAFTAGGFVNALFYGTVYLFINMGVFMVVNYFEKKHGFVEMKDYSGSITSHPFLLALLGVLFIALTGLPPTGGFTAKFLIFSSLWESYTLSADNWMLYLLLFGILNTVVALFYYLKIPYYAIFKQREMEPKLSTQLSYENFIVGIMLMLVLVIFFRPDWLMEILNSINFAF